MQTLHSLRSFRDLRAISLRQGLSRWRTPSDALRAGMKGPPGLSNSPGPTSAVGWRPASRHPERPSSPVAGAGVPGVPRLRAARTDSRGPVLPCRVCRWQTADVSHQFPAHHKAGEIDGPHRQARASTIMRMVSGGPSFTRRPAHHKAGAAPEKTLARMGDGSGTRRSEAPGFRPTGRLKPVPSTKVTGPTHLPFCASTSAPVTGQEPGGTKVPCAAQRRCGRTLRSRFRLRRG